MSVIHPSGVCAIDERERRGSVPRRGDDDTTGVCPVRPPPGRRARTVPPRVMERIALLPQRDRAIVELTLRSNLSRTAIAGALGTSPGQVSRRFRTLYARLHDPLVVALFDARCPLTPEYRQLAIEHYLQGESAPALAEKHRLPADQARRMLAHVRWWHRGMNAGRADRSSISNLKS